MNVDEAWRTAIRDAFRESFDRFERALRDCPDAIWQESLWPVAERRPIRHGLGAGLPEAVRRQSFSAFWFVAWHTLNVAHYDIEGEELPEGWGPPPPFDTYVTDAETLPPRAWTRAELLHFGAVTRQRVDEIVAALTGERLARPIPSPHRYAGRPYAWLLLLCVTHTREHVAQLDLFLGQHGVART